MTHQLAVIGAGNMAEAIVRGILREKAIPADRIIAADISPARRELFQRELGVRAVESPAEAAAGARMILLSIKPQQMTDLLKSISGAVGEQSLVISIAAGIPTGRIEAGLTGGGRRRVIRVMPNTPMLVGEGMVAICHGRHATPEDMAEARGLFTPAADVIEVEESQMNAVTAVSGSGPAYFYFLVEQLAAAAEALGLSPEHAQRLARRTAVGSARMLAQSQDSAAELRRKVTSPGGTTQAAITYMESHDWPGLTRRAIEAAAHRAEELSK